MQTQNKTEQIAHLQGKRASESDLAVQAMLTAYRDTRLTQLQVSPLMHGSPVLGRLDHEAREELNNDKEKDKH